MKIVTPSFFVLGLFVLGGFIFKATSPMTCGDIMPNDSIFVLTGDVRRIPFAMRKAREFPDANIYIVGVGAQNYNLDNMPNNIQIESKSKSTYQNALAIKKIAIEHELNRIVIITTEEHTNRAQYLIKSELPNTHVVLCPTTLTGMSVTKRIERWTTEYIKYIVTMFGIKEG